MKRLVLILLFITILLFKIPSVFALDVNVKEVTIYDKNDTITVSNITADGSEIIPKITFNKINDYVTFKISFKGKDIDKYKIKSITDNNKSEYIKTSYSSKEYLSDDVFVVFEYYKESNKDTSINNINITINLEDENGNKEEVVVNDKSREDVTSNSQTGTLSRIITPLILIVITVLLIRYYSKYKDIGTLIILLLAIVPITVIAEGISIALTINTKNIQIKGINTSTKTEYVVYLYPNGGTGINDNYPFKYTETTSFSKFPKVEKTNCTLDGWNIDSPNGKEYNEDVEPIDNGKKLYARWNCNSSNNSNLKLKVTSGASYTLNKPIDTFLKEKGSSLSNYNEYIKQSINAAGYGTRDGVVAAAVSMINYLYDNYNTKLPYYWGGQPRTIGLTSKIGSNIPSQPSTSGTVYDYFSFDCIGLVRWAILNAGFNLPRSKLITNENFPSCNILDNSCVGEPGDVIDNPSHIVLIASVDKANEIYYVAEATTSGVIVQTRAMHKNMNNAKTQIIKLQGFYNNKSNLY